MMVIAGFVNPNACTILLQFDAMIGSHDERPVTGDMEIEADDISAVFAVVFIFHKDRGIDGAFPGKVTCLVLWQVNVTDPGVWFKNHLHVGGNLP